MSDATTSDGDAPAASSDLAGWERRTTIDEPRLSELVELYRELGFEVMVRPVSREELGSECNECLLAQADRYRTIYTRRPAGGESADEQAPSA